MKDVFISDSIVYVGVDDKNIDLFESQYVVPNGVSYNSYVILDDKIRKRTDQKCTVGYRRYFYQRRVGCHALCDTETTGCEQSCGETGCKV